jgi:hypothetical protein
MRLHILKKISAVTLIIAALTAASCGSEIFDAFGELSAPGGTRVSPPDGSYLSINGPGTAIILRFTKSMEPSTLKLSGELAADTETSWSSSIRGDDTLKISLNAGKEWPAGAKGISVKCKDINGNDTTHSLKYNIIDAVRYVSATGSMEVTCGAINDPCLRVQGAVENIKTVPGQKAVLISEGTYHTPNENINISTAAGFTGDIVISGGFSPDFAVQNPLKHETELTQENATTARILVNADNADLIMGNTTIEKLTLKAGGSTAEDSTAIFITGGMTIRNCRIFSGSADASGKNSSAVFGAPDSKLFLDNNQIYMNSGYRSYGILSMSQLSAGNNTIYFPSKYNIDSPVSTAIASAGAAEIMSNTIRPVSDEKLPADSKNVTTFTGIQFEADTEISLIDNNTITMPAGQKADSSYGLRIEKVGSAQSGTFNVTNNTVYGSGNEAAVTTQSTGMHLSAVDSGEGTHFHISNNTVYGTGSGAAIGSGSTYGIYMDIAVNSNADLKDNTIYAINSSASAGYSKGIYCDNSGKNLNITDNKIIGQAAGSVTTHNSYSVHIEIFVTDPVIIITGNTILGQESSAITDPPEYLYGLNLLYNPSTTSKNLTISGNTITGGYTAYNDIYGLYISRDTADADSDIQITGNRITGSLKSNELAGFNNSGVYLENVKKYTLKNNIITGGYSNNPDSTVRGINSINSGSDSVARTRIEANTIYATRDKTASTLTSVIGCYMNSEYSQYYDFINNVIVPAADEINTWDYNNEAQGMKGVSINGPNSVRFYNNTIASGRSTNYSSACVYNHTGIADDQFINNIFIINSTIAGSNGIIYTGSLSGSNVEVSNNCFYNAGGAGWEPVFSIVAFQELNENGQFYNSEETKITGSGNILQTTGISFAGESSGNFRLTSSTPSGVRTGGLNGIANGWGFDTDITDKKRPAAPGGWSMGAYQYP